MAERSLGILSNETSQRIVPNQKIGQTTSRKMNELMHGTYDDFRTPPLQLVFWHCNVLRKVDWSWCHEGSLKCGVERTEGRVKTLPDIRWKS